MTTTSSDVFNTPPECTLVVRRLLLASDEDFEDGITRLDVRDLLQLISCLQYEMAVEQQRFDQLNKSFKGHTEEYWEIDGPSSLSSSLCQSQIRLAQLCNRNMRCFTQQAARAQQDRTSFQTTPNISREDTSITTYTNFQNSQISPPRNRSPSPIRTHNFSPAIQQPHSPSGSFAYVGNNSNGIYGPDRQMQADTSGNNKGLWGVRMKVRAPSVEDILKNVRSLRLEKDDESASSDEDEYVRQHHNYQRTHTRNDDDKHLKTSSSVGNEYDLVPTATQLLLRSKPNTTKSPSPEYGSEADLLESTKRDVLQPDTNDAICSQSGDLSGIPRSNLSCPNLQSNSVALDKVFESTAKHGINHENGENEVEKDDDDSGVGPDELPKSLGHRKRPQRRILLDDLFKPFSPLPTSESSIVPEVIQQNGFMPNSNNVNNNNNNNNNNGTSVHGSDANIFEDEDEGEIIPSIIDQFTTHPLPEAEAFRRQKGTNIQWNPNRLLEELYTIPSPKAPAIPPAAYINLEGYLEKLPSGRRQATFWNAWKRRYFRLKDGHLFCYAGAKSEEPSVVLQLMGGKVDTVETTLLGIDDGKGHYVVVRCGSRADTERWRRALITHTAENYSLTYAQPVVAYPQFYEDVLIIDVGSCSVRAGILCNQPTLPQVYFPTVCAKDKTTGRTVFGKEALRPKTRLGSSVTFPLRPSAKITKFSVDLDAVKGLLSKVFHELNVDPSDYQVQLSLPRNFPFHSQTEVLDLLMTEFGVRSVNLTAQTVLALCSYNSTSGIVVDIGERMEIIPIVDGYVIEPGVTRIPYGGTRLLDHLRHFLMQSHYGLASETESFLLRYILEHACYLAEHYNTELQKFYTNPQSFEVSLPVSQFFEGDAPWETITLDSGRFQAPEGLFNPDAWGLDNPGVHKLVYKAIQECSLDVRKEMSKRIYLSGGVTTLPGFSERLQLEVDRLTPPAIIPKVHASSYRAHAAYLGACILASSAGFHEAKVTRDDWIANGSACLKKWHF